MKLISIIAASVLSGSFALGATSDTVQTPSKKPMAAPSAQTPPRSYSPDMTQMPKTYLEATILYNQNGQAVFVDTSGQALPLSRSSEPQETIAPQIRIQPSKPNDKTPDSGSGPKSLKGFTITPEQLQTLRRSFGASPRSQYVPDLQISHWLTPISPMTSNEIH